MASRQTELKPNRELLDPNFDGYKLSLDPLPIYKSEIVAGLDEAQLTESQYSYQHVKAFSAHNHLVLDAWNPNSVYIVDDNWKLQKFVVHQETSLEPPASVLHIPESSNQKLVPGRHNVTLFFPTDSLCILADGADRLYISHTGDRKQDVNWKICHSCAPLGAGVSFVLRDARHSVVGECQKMDCLLLHVAEETQKYDNDKDKKSGTDFATRLEWLTFNSENGYEWSLERTRRLQGRSAPDYVAFTADCRAVAVASAKTYKFMYDSLKPVEDPKAFAAENGGMSLPPAYTWQQTSEEVTLQFTLTGGAGKAEVLFKLTPDSIELGVKNGMKLLCGTLHARVDAETSTWILDQNRLEVTLLKAEDGEMWPLVVLGDTRGQMVLDEAQVAAIHERLASLTSEHWNANPDAGKAAYNSQELEACDMFPEDSFCLQLLHGDSHDTIQKVNLSSNQWLFNAHLEPNKPHAMCLRHDVDGLLWQLTDSLEENVVPFEHVGTFNALGYVQASKQQRKFATCAPDMSYAILADCVRHVYVYRQPSAITSPLRNRRTGREVAAVAKQQVISLESTENILGMQATNDRLFLMAGKTLYVVSVNDSTETI